jgi:hypothetical protein
MPALPKRDRIVLDRIASSMFLAAGIADDSGRKSGFVVVGAIVRTWGAAVLRPYNIIDI